MSVGFKSRRKRHPSASSEVKLREDKVRTQKETEKSPGFYPVLCGYATLSNSGYWQRGEKNTSNDGLVTLGVQLGEELFLGPERTFPSWSVRNGERTQAAAQQSPHHIVSPLMTCTYHARGVNQQTIAAWVVKKKITVSVNSIMNYENTTGQGRGKEGGIREREREQDPEQSRKKELLPVSQRCSEPALFAPLQSLKCIK